MSLCCICREIKDSLFNAHTDYEHLFCKECIVNYISSTNSLNCPVCHTIIGNVDKIFAKKRKLMKLLLQREDGYDIILRLLGEGQDIQEYPHQKILSKTIEVGNVEIVKLLTRDSISVPSVNPSGLVKTGDFDLLNYFMTSSNRNDFGSQVLYEIVKHDKMNFALDLVKTFRLKDWHPALVLAAQKGDQETLKFCFNRFKLSLYANFSMLFAAALFTGEMETAKWLLDQNDKIVLEKTDQIMCTHCFNYASASSNIYEIILPTEFAKRIKTSFENFCKCCTTPFSLACRAGNLDLVREMHTKYQMDLNSNNCSSLFSSLTSNNIELVRFLLSNGVDANARGNIAFYYAACNPNNDFFSLLWNHGKRNFSRQDYGHLAKTLIVKGKAELASILIAEWKACSFLVEQQKAYIEVLKLAINANFLDVIEEMLKFNLTQSSWNSSFQLLQNIFVEVSEKRSGAMLQLFISHIPELLKCEGSLQCLKLAILNRNQDNAMILILNGADTNVYDVRNERRSLLSHAVDLKLWDVAHLLVDRGVNVNIDTQFILTRVCVQGKWELLDKIITKGCLYRTFLEALIVTPTLNNNLLEVLKYFHEKGDDIFYDGRILKYAVCSGLVEVIKYLCSAKQIYDDGFSIWPTALINNTDTDTLLYLHSVFPFDEERFSADIDSTLYCNRSSVLRFLLAINVKLNKKLKRYYHTLTIDNILLIMKVSNISDIDVKEIIKRAFNESHIEFLKHMEQTYGVELMLSEFSLLLEKSETSSRHLNLVLEYLLSKECYPIPQIMYHCMRLACQNSDLSLLKKAIDKGADINAGGGQLLGYAAASNRLDVLDLLLSNGADCDQEFARKGLELAVKHDQTDILSYLRKREIIIDDLLLMIPAKKVRSMTWNDFDKALNMSDTVGNHDSDDVSEDSDGSDDSSEYSEYSDESEESDDSESSDSDVEN